MSLEGTGGRAGSDTLAGKLDRECVKRAQRGRVERTDHDEEGQEGRKGK